MDGEVAFPKAIDEAAFSKALACAAVDFADAEDEVGAQRSLSRFLGWEKGDETWRRNAQNGNIMETWGDLMLFHSFLSKMVANEDR